MNASTCIKVVFPEPAIPIVIKTVGLVGAKVSFSDSDILASRGIG